jgi:hypothetical protein
MTIEVPDEILDYYKEKHRDLPKPVSTPVSDLLRRLDVAIIKNLNLGGSQEDVDRAFEAVLSHPENTWTEETLSYRIRQLHYH